MPDQVQANNKLVRFRGGVRGYADKERTMPVPKHLRGRGLISEKASAAMTGVENAAQARAFQGHKLKPRSKAVGVKPHGGRKVTAAAKYPNPTHKPKHSKFAKRAGHNPPKPEFGQQASLSDSTEGGRVTMEVMVPAFKDPNDPRYNPTKKQHNVPRPSKTG